MGWLWASPSPPKPAQESQPPPPSSSAPNEPEPIDPELQKFFDMFKTDSNPPPKKESSSESQPSTSSSSSQPPSDNSSSSSSSSSSWFSLHASSSPSAKLNTAPAPDAPPRDALSEALLPDTMSCRQAFDLAWACNSLGGQWNAVYREGAMRSCSAHWDDFWFCMRAKGYAPEMRERAVRQHYRNREHDKYGPGKPSSEDVWRSRDRRVEPGTAFAQPVDIAPLDDDEWRRAENERRQRIRHELGYGKASS